MDQKSTAELNKICLQTIIRKWIPIEQFSCHNKKYIQNEVTIKIRATEALCTSLSNLFYFNSYLSCNCNGNDLNVTNSVTVMYILTSYGLILKLSNTHYSSYIFGTFHF